jgi:hypothetical protein
LIKECAWYGAVPFFVWFDILYSTESFYLLFGLRVYVVEWTPLLVHT